MKPFKECTVCLKIWNTRESFLKCPGIKLIGYQPDFEFPEIGQFLFNHTVEGCGTTLSVPVTVFMDLYNGPVFSELIRGTQDCPGKCLSINDTSPCTAKCSMAHIRRLMQIIIFSNFPGKPATDRIELLRL